MIVNGTTKVYGLIGNPVEHTLSPMIHAFLAERMHLNMTYVPFCVKEDLKSAVKGANALGIQGMNVTVPDKIDVIPMLKEIDELALEIGAVNTLVPIKDGGYKGYNTDISGLKRAMESDGIFLKGKSVVVLGAGGAARAVAFLLAKEEADKIYILNRTFEKAKVIAEHVNRYLKKEVAVPMLLSDYKSLPNSFVAIQASSVGLNQSEDVIIEEEDFYKRVEVGYDLIYKPFETKFMKCVQAQGKQSYNGLKMLVYQGIHAFELWNDCVVSNELAESLCNELEKMVVCHE